MLFDQRLFITFFLAGITAYLLVNVIIYIIMTISVIMEAFSRSSIATTVSAALFKLTNKEIFDIALALCEYDFPFPPPPPALWPVFSCVIAPNLAIFLLSTCFCLALVVGYKVANCEPLFFSFSTLCLILLPFLSSGADWHLPTH